MSILFKKKYKKFLSISGGFSHKFNISNLILNNLLYISETFFVVSTFYTFIFGLIFFFEKKKINLISAGDYKYKSEFLNKDENDVKKEKKNSLNVVKVEKTAVTSYTFNKVKIYLGDEETYFSRYSKVRPFSDLNLNFRINSKLDILKYNTKLNLDEKLLIKKKDQLYDVNKFNNFNEIDSIELEEKPNIFYNNNFSLFSKKKLFLLDLVQSSFLFRRTLLFLFNLLILGGSLLLVNEFFSHFRLFWLYLFVYVHHIFCVSNIWVSGYLSNFTIKKKKNLQLLFSKEKKLYQKNFYLPDFVFVLFSSKTPVISKECRFLGIPLGGLINAFYSPYYFDYMIPANNLMESTIFFFSKFFLELLNKMKLVRKFYFKLNVYSVLKKSDITNIFFYLGFKTYLKNNNLLYRGLYDIRVGFSLLKKKYKLFYKDILSKTLMSIKHDIKFKLLKFYNIKNTFILFNGLFKNQHYFKQLQFYKNHNSVVDYTSNLEKKFYYLFSFLRKNFLRFKKVNKYFLISSKRNFFRQFKVLFKIVKFFFFLKNLLKRKRELKKKYFNIFFYKLFIQLMNSVLYFRSISRSLKKRLKKKRFKRFFFRRRKVRKFYRYIKSVLKSNFFLKKKIFRKKKFIRKKNRFFFKRHLIFFHYKYEVFNTLVKTVKKKIVFNKILIRKQNYFLRKRLANVKKYNQLSLNSYDSVNKILKKKYKNIFKFMKDKLKHKTILNKLIFKLIRLRDGQLHSKLIDLRFARSLNFLDGSRFLNSKFNKLKLRSKLIGLKFNSSLYKLGYSKSMFNNYVRLTNIVKLFFININKLKINKEILKKNQLIYKLEKEGIFYKLKKKTSSSFLPMHKSIQNNVFESYETFISNNDGSIDLTWLNNNLNISNDPIFSKNENLNFNFDNLNDNGGFIFLKKLLYFNNSFNVFLLNSIINFTKSSESVDNLSYDLFFKHSLLKTVSQKRLGLGLLKYLRVGLKNFFKYNSYYFSNNYFRSRYGKMYSFKKIFNNFRKSKIHFKAIKTKFINYKNKNIFSLYLSLFKFVKIKLIFTILFIKFNLFLIFYNNLYFLFYFYKILIKFYKIFVIENINNIYINVCLFEKFKNYIKKYVNVKDLFIFYYLNFKFFYSIFIRNYLNNFKLITFFNYKLFKSFLYKNNKFVTKFSNKFDFLKSNLLNDFFSLKKKNLLLNNDIRYFNFNGTNFNYYFFKFLIYGFSFKINNIKFKIQKFIRDKYSNFYDFNLLFNYKKIILNKVISSPKLNYFFLFKFLKTRKNRLRSSKNAFKLLNFESSYISFIKIKKKLRKRKKFRRVVYFKSIKKIRNWLQVFGERARFNFVFLKNFLSSGFSFASGLNFKNYLILSNFLMFSPSSGLNYGLYKKQKKKNFFSVFIKLKNFSKKKLFFLKLKRDIFLKKFAIKEGSLKKFFFGFSKEFNILKNKKKIFKFSRRLVRVGKKKIYKFFFKKKFIDINVIIDSKRFYNGSFKRFKSYRKSFKKNNVTYGDKVDFKFFINFLKKRKFKYFYIKFFINFLKIFKKFKCLDFNRFSKDLKKIFFKKYFFYTLNSLKSSD